MRITKVTIVAVTVAIALLALVAEAPEASLRILWRHAVLSFDNPTTQIFDEMASVSSGLTDPDVGADQFSRLPLASRFVPCPEPVPFASPALSSGITRSPPAA